MIKMTKAFTLIAVLVFSCSSYAEPIEFLLMDLDSGLFKVREEASRKLEAKGVEALPYLIEAVKSDNPEVASRADSILKALAYSFNDRVAKATIVALDELSSIPEYNDTWHSFVVGLDLQLHKRALDYLESKGARISSYPDMYDYEYRYYANPDWVLDFNFEFKWTGDDEDLLYLTHIQNIRRVTIDTPDLTDRAMRILGTGNIEVDEIRLSKGSVIDPSAVREFSGRNDHVKMVYNRGGFDGMAFVYANDADVMVSYIYEGSPAIKAGILPGDVISSINGFDVYNESLSPEETEEIVSQHNPGEKINITIFRDSVPLSFEVKLINRKPFLDTLPLRIYDFNIKEGD